MMKRVLVAEDDEFLAQAYKLKLTKSGCEVKVAKDGREALAILKEFKPDVLLLDLMMPVMDGFAVLAELKKTEEYKHLPVMVASNLGQKEDLDRAMALGATDYIVKSNAQIADIVNKLLKL